MSERLLAVLWALLYTVVFLFRAGRRAAEETVDLSRGRIPQVHALGYTIQRWTLTTEETARVAGESRAAGRTVTQSLAEALGRALFTMEPDKRRVLLSLPVHLGGDPRVPGNPTGSLLVQLFRDRPLAPQVRAAFRGFRRGVPLGLARIVAATSKNERALLDRFAAQARVPVPARAPFENFTCALSSLGVIHQPGIVAEVEGIRAHGMTQTIFFGVMTLEGRMTIEAAAANDLFDARDVEHLGDAMKRALLCPEEDAGFSFVGEDTGIRAAV